MKLNLPVRVDQWHKTNWDRTGMAPLVEPIRDEPDSHMGDRQGQEVKHPVMKPDATLPNNKGT